VQGRHSISFFSRKISIENRTRAGRVKSVIATFQV